jgi:predicted DNA-binding transcriptional regulator YafY
MRASRLVNLLLLLQTRGRMTAAQLARELEVSVRTVHRDVDALSAAGVPIYAERGPYGGVQLVDGYRTRLTGMTAEEAEALFLSGLPGPAAELGLGTVVAAARLKVLAALPPELRARASRLVERFHLDAAGWFRSGDAVPHLATLAEAVWEERRVAITYDRGDSGVERVLEPVGLVLKGGIWYVVALVEGQVRTYRVSRVTAATVLDERFERPPKFDLASYWAESIAAYEREAPRVSVTVRLKPERRRELPDFIGGPSAATAEELDGQEADPDGWLRLRIRMDWPEEAPARLLSLGSDVEVVDPPEIRRRVSELARAVAQRYPIEASAPGALPAPSPSAAEPRPAGRTGGVRGEGRDDPAVVAAAGGGGGASRGEPRAPAPRS